MRETLADIYENRRTNKQEMITKEDLEKKYSTFSNSELLDIIQDKFSYTDIAVLVAMSEISKRNLNEQDIKKYKTAKELEIKNFIQKNIVDDLSFLQKNLFFYIWIPFLNFPFKRNFFDDGFELKLKQANYYSWLGFAFCVILSAIHSNYKFSTIVFLIIWMATFLVTFLFDEFFNRQSQIRKLQKIFNVESEDEISHKN